MVGQAAFQTNVIAMRSIASFLSAGRVSAFNLAYLIMLLPHGVFALSLATVTFPTMSAQYAEGNLVGLRATLARAVKVLLFLTIPSAVGMFMLREELVAALFQFGRFGVQSTELVAAALQYFAPGLIAYAVVEVITRGFYALHDTATPVAVSVGTVLLNLGTSILLIRGLGWDYEGLALSLALTTTAEMILLWVMLSRKLPGWRLSAEGMLSSIARSCGAAIAMGLVLALVMPLLEQVIPLSSASKLQIAALAAAGVAVGAVVYLLGARLLRSAELDEALGLLARRLGKGKKA